MRTRWMLVGLLAVAAGVLGLRPMLQKTPAPVSAAQESAADVKSDGTHASPQSASNVGMPAPSPNGPPGNIVLGAPAIEPEEVLETMTKDELKTEIAQIDEDLARRDAVKRLNEERVSADERVELGAMIQRESLMKGQLAKMQLAEIEQSVAAYEKEHAARVAAYVHKKK